MKIRRSLYWDGALVASETFCDGDVMALKAFVITVPLQKNCQLPVTDGKYYKRAFIKIWEYIYNLSATKKGKRNHMETCSFKKKVSPLPICNALSEQ